MTPEEEYVEGCRQAEAINARNRELLKERTGLPCEGDSKFLLVSRCSDYRNPHPIDEFPEPLRGILEILRGGGQ